jgi:hypothetical protein
VRTENQEKILEILEKFPFLTFGVMHDEEYLGIVQNCDNQFVSMYIIDLIPSEEQRALFMEFGDRWWWESNRKVPINVFIKDPRFKLFRTCLRMFSAKDFEIVQGPTVSLAESINRRIRKRQVVLVRKMD